MKRTGVTGVIRPTDVRPTERLGDPTAVRSDRRPARRPTDRPHHPVVALGPLARTVEFDLEFVEPRFPLRALLLVVLEEFLHQLRGLLLAAATEPLATDALLVDLRCEIVVVPGEQVGVELVDRAL